MGHTTRFAPSPTGLLHPGHAYAAWMAAASADGGVCLLRLEDLDPVRCRPEYAVAIREDLAWLGLSWPEPVLLQSTRSEAYGAALERLQALGLLYPCFCTRRQIQAEITGAAQAPHQGTVPVYPGTCRVLSLQERSARLERGDPYALRLDVARAASRCGSLSFSEAGKGPDGQSGLISVQPALLGDIVLSRRDAPAAYHLAVVVDDAYQGVTCVTRGEDLFHATHVQRLLQAVLELPEPSYAHHRLILDERARKLSKRSGSTTLRALRAQGWTPAALKAYVGFGS